jgi:hypothetical protein
MSARSAVATLESARSLDRQARCRAEDVIAALQDGIRLAERKAAAKAAGDWIALVYGR